MDWPWQLNANTFVLFTLVLARVGGMILTAPICGTREVPLQVRGLLAFALAALLTPTQSRLSAVEPASALGYVVLIAAESLIGLFLGLGIVFLFSGIQLAGALVGRLGGFMLADVLDPSTNEPVPLLGRFMWLFALVVFVAVGGHRMAVGALLDTFRALPPGSMASAESMAHVLRELLAQSFALAIRVAAPVAVAVLLSTLAMGLVGRAMPQLDVLALGLGLNSMLTVGLLAIVLGAGAMLFQTQVTPTMHLLVNALDSQSLIPNP